MLQFFFSFPFRLFLGDVKIAMVFVGIRADFFLGGLE
jgi:hypothetical protein